MKYDTISSDDVLAQHLMVMDSTATSLSMDNHIPVLLFALASVPAAVLAMGLAAWLGPRLEEEKLQKGAIVLFLLGGVSIIVKSVVFHT